MAEKTITFTCWHCNKNTTIIVTVSQPTPRQSNLVPIPKPCQYCNKINKVPVPDNVDVHRFILGKDQGFLGYTPQGIPILQGEKY